MLFSSVIFLIWFLPVFYTLYLISGSHKNLVLLMASLIFYGWYEPGFVLLILAESLAGYFGALLMERFSKARKAVFIGLILIIVGLFVFFKYTDFLISVWNGLSGMEIGLLHIVLPLGISFYSFQILSYLIDVFKREVPARRNPIDFCMYICMFPQLIAGPIVRYEQIAPSLDHHPISWSLADRGIGRFVIGLAKKVILANGFYALWLACVEQTSSFLMMWVGMAANLFYIYFDFSGYSDMAIGLGALLGFHFPENFDYPIAAGSLQQFWRKWHMSLTGWFRDYIYIPLGGSRKGTWITLRNLLVVWLLTGIWHGAGWTYILWGLGFFLLLSLERFTPAMPGIVKRIWMLVWVLVLFDLFSAQSLQSFWSEMQVLFHPSLHIEAQGIYLLRSNAVLIAAGLIGCTPWPARMGRWILHKAWLLRPLFLAGLLLVCISFLVGGSFNPFLYFRF